MRLPLSLLAAGAALFATGTAGAACSPGVYGDQPDRFVVIGPPSSTGVQRYIFLDGRRGKVGDSDGAVSCDTTDATVRSADGSMLHWTRRDTPTTRTTFTSWNTKFAGELIEPAGPVDPNRPLVVFVHGSERSAWLDNASGYMFAARGIAAFVYDKRGTGASEGEYTQNFELLADDAAAALGEARRLAAGRFSRAGYVGGSQGGWVAPLAATRSPADFVEVGFGLVATPIEEDRDQMLLEADAAHLDAKAHAQIRQLSAATAGLVRSHFERGYEALAAVKREIGDAPWATTIAGEYSGDMLRTPEADLRRTGRARFDNLELIWDYDAVSALKRLKVPLLWVMAGEDREAPLAMTRPALLSRVAAGQPIDLYLFPDTDHGIMEYRTNPDGSRTTTKTADGYMRLITDWAKRDVHGPYGRAEILAATAYRTAPPAVRSRSRRAVRRP